MPLFRSFPHAAIMLLAAIVAMYASACAADPGGSDRIVIASDPWCPYACNPDSDGADGYMVDLAREILGEAGLTLEYRVVNFQVLRRMAEDGSATLVPGVASDLYGTLVLPDRAQGNSPNAVAVSRLRPFRWSGPESFAGHRLGVIRDYNYGGALQRYIDSHQSDPDRIEVLSGFGYSHVAQGLRLLEAGRIDLLLDDYNVLRWHLRRSPQLDGLEVVPLDDQADLFVGVAIRNPRAADLTRLLAEGTERLRRSGRLAAILARYGLSDWQNPL